MCLPTIYDASLQLPYIALGGLLFAIFYLGVERVLIFQPKAVPQLWLDRKIRFMPWTIWIYQSTVPFMLLLYFWVADVDQLNRLLFAFTALLISSSFFFFFFPTTVPRTDYPLPEKLDLLTRLNFERLRALDHPVNCVPSMHVSMTLLFTLFFAGAQSVWFPLIALWALLIVFSTMTTKQHYFIDVIAGAVLGLIVYVLFFHIIC